MHRTPSPSFYYLSVGLQRIFPNLQLTALGCLTDMCHLRSPCHSHYWIFIFLFFCTRIARVAIFVFCFAFLEGRKTSALILQCLAFREFPCLCPPPPSHIPPTGEARAGGRGRGLSPQPRKGGTGSSSPPSSPAGRRGSAGVSSKQSELVFPPQPVRPVHWRKIVFCASRESEDSCVCSEERQSAIISVDVTRRWPFKPPSQSSGVAICLCISRNHCQLPVSGWSKISAAPSVGILGHKNTMKSPARELEFDF